MDKPHVCAVTPVVGGVVEGVAEGKAIARFVFAHGAGAGMDTDFMVEVSRLLALKQIESVRFNFPYMQIMSETGKRRPPNRMPQLLEYYKDFIEGLAEQVKTLNGDLPLFIGGKSMGGRASTMLVTQPELKGLIKGVIALGYPFHPSGKPEKLRVDHLPDMLAPCLIIQGDRDPMGRKEEIAGYDLPKALELVYLTDGEHGFKPRKASGVTLQDNLETAVENMARFIVGLV
ncbi:MAG: putative alpha/beta-hydrolase family hydrolase [Phenylobacterium sp.]|jgi:predicted alpha/beta-hydrolase family hydrolase